ncbi:hypothetical protein [Pleionea sp. CnH1-48]|nr:hypothetical protein [Pleionea sp. CnH1-48]
MILAAYTAQQDIRVYAHSCGPVGWYSVATTTYNFLSSGSISVRR